MLLLAPVLQVGSIYQLIYALVCAIPKGKVATYGQIAGLIGGCTARMVGYALAALPRATKVPWHRVVNSEGMISARNRGDGASRQRRWLEKEGVKFDQRDRIDLKVVLWRNERARVSVRLTADV